MMSSEPRTSVPGAHEIDASLDTASNPPQAFGVSTFWVEKYEREACKNWNKFYKANGTRAYKDRHWMQNEDTDGFLELSFVHAPGAEIRTCGSPRRECQTVVLEVGCGVGNTALPLLESSNQIFIHAFDFAPSAVEIIKKQEWYAKHADRCHVFVCDIAAANEDSLAFHVAPKSVDIVLLFFVLSAIGPEHHLAVMQNLASVLKPGGVVLFRDYAVGDLAERRFKPSNQMSEHWFVRQDGTRSFFFEESRLNSICEQAGLCRRSSRVVTRSIANRKLDLLMERRWLQAVYYSAPIISDVSN